MGLASYGRPRHAAAFARMVHFENGRLKNDNSWFAFHTGGANCYSQKFIDEFGPPCPDERHVEEGNYKDLAASGQKLTEDLILRMAAWCRKETGEEHLCLAGGVALNSVANGRLRDENIYADIWVNRRRVTPAVRLESLSTSGTSASAILALTRWITPTGAPSPDSADGAGASLARPLVPTCRRCRA